MVNQRSIFQALESHGVFISDEQKRTIEEKINSILNYRPRVGIFGKTGVGKSSLCNALFGTEICPISDIEACTREPKEVLLKMGASGITLIDVPGVGENRDRDVEYSKLYANLLPELDLILWVIKADDRAMSSDEEFFKRIVKPYIDENKPFFFVINQVDKIEPFREWDINTHEPGLTQARNITRKIDALSVYFAQPSSQFIAVSAAERYNLVTLVNEIVYALPKEKQISVYKSVDDGLKTEKTTRRVADSFVASVSEIINKAVDFAYNTAAVVTAVKDVVLPVAKKIVTGIASFIRLLC